MQLFDALVSGDYEQLVVAVDQATGLKAFICIHDTTLGPALGGCRIWPHATEEDALRDVVRLSRAMTYKSAAAGLDLGGGKALIWGDPRTALDSGAMQAFGRHVESLGGRYITTEDVGVTPDHLLAISRTTRHVVGLVARNTSQVTGFGVYRGIKAAVQDALGTDALDGVVFAVQGFGKVATALAERLLAEGARLTVADVNPAALERARAMGCTVLADPDAIYDVDCDVFSPCALGGAISRDTIPRLRCQVVAGAANNQLTTPEDGVTLWKSGITYVPDFIINAGGVINVAYEVGRAYDESAVMERVSHVYDTVGAVLRASKEQGVPTHQAAERLAEERIRTARVAHAAGKNGAASAPGVDYQRVRTPAGGVAATTT